MKALSLTQPWAHAILHHGKRIENREWKGCSYRGPILLHASKSVGTRADFDDTCEALLDIGLTREDLLVFAQEHIANGPASADRWVPQATLQRGGIVGRARIADVLDPRRDGEEFREVLSRGRQRRWWMGGFALILADVEPLPFVPWRGELGLFEVPGDYATRPQPAHATGRAVPFRQRRTS